MRILVLILISTTRKAKMSTKWKKNITKTEMELIKTPLSIWEWPTNYQQIMNSTGRLSSMTAFKTMRFCLNFLHLQNMKLKVSEAYWDGN